MTPQLKKAFGRWDLHRLHDRGTHTLTEPHFYFASTRSCMNFPNLRISYIVRKYIRDDRMRFGSSRQPKYATFRMPSPKLIPQFTFLRW